MVGVAVRKLGVLKGFKSMAHAALSFSVIFITSETWHLGLNIIIPRTGHFVGGKFCIGGLEETQSECNFFAQLPIKVFIDFHLE